MTTLTQYQHLPRPAATTVGLAIILAFIALVAAVSGTDPTPADTGSTATKTEVWTGNVRLSH